MPASRFAIAAWLLPVVLTMAVPPSAPAAPLDPSRIDARAQWLVHFDADACRRSTSVQKYIRPMLETPAMRKKVDEIEQAVGLNPLEDIHEITLYGNELMPNHGVLIVRSDVDLEQLGRFVEKQPDHATEQRDGLTIHRWTNRHGGDPHTVHATMHGPTTMVFSRHVDELTDAYAVLEGKRPSLQVGESPLVAHIPDDTILLAGARGLWDSKLGLKSPILRLSEMLTIVVGEPGEEGFVEVRLEAKSAEHVPDFKDVAEGLLAVARLLRADDRQVLDVLEGVEIQTDDKSVTARWSGSMADAVKVILKERMRIPGGPPLGR